MHAATSQGTKPFRRDYPICWSTTVWIGFSAATARCAWLWTTTRTTTEQRPRSDCVSWTALPTLNADGYWVSLPGAGAVPAAGNSLDDVLSCGLWGLSPSAWPTGSAPIPSISRIAPSRRFVACAYADRSSALDLSMSLLPFDWGSRTHRHELCCTSRFSANATCECVPSTETRHQLLRRRN
jgi:hypothetical protein